MPARAREQRPPGYSAVSRSARPPAVRAWASCSCTRSSNGRPNAGSPPSNCTRRRTLAASTSSSAMPPTATRSPRPGSSTSVCARNCSNRSPRPVALTYSGRPGKLSQTPLSRGGTVWRVSGGGGSGTPRPRGPLPGVPAPPPHARQHAGGAPVPRRGAALRESNDPRAGRRWPANGFHDGDPGNRPGNTSKSITDEGRPNYLDETGLLKEAAA